MRLSRRQQCPVAWQVPSSCLGIWKGHSNLSDPRSKKNRLSAKKESRLSLDIAGDMRERLEHVEEATIARSITKVARQSLIVCQALVRMAEPIVVIHVEDSNGRLSTEPFSLAP